MPCGSIIITIQPQCLAAQHNNQTVIIMEILGTLDQKAAIISGTSQKGTTFSKLDVVMLTAETFPVRIALSAFNEVANRLNEVPIGTTLKVNYRISANEYNGRWYNNVTLTHFQILAPVNETETKPQQPAQQTTQQAHQTPTQSTPRTTTYDDLPF